MLLKVDLLTRVNEILQKYKLDHLGNQFELYLYGHDSINYVDNYRDILEIYKGNSSFLDLKLVFPGVFWVWVGG